MVRRAAFLALAMLAVGCTGREEVRLTLTGPPLDGPRCLIVDEFQQRNLLSLGSFVPVAMVELEGEGPFEVRGDFCPGRRVHFGGVLDGRHDYRLASSNGRSTMLRSTVRPIACGDPELDFERRRMAKHRSAVALGRAAYCGGGAQDHP